jgi:hypothetical protein
VHGLFKPSEFDLQVRLNPLTAQAGAVLMFDTQTGPCPWFDQVIR